jgi:hypothetical protein
VTRLVSPALVLAGRIDADLGNGKTGFHITLSTSNMSRARLRGPSANSGKRGLMIVRISRHNSHYVYGAIQSNITCSITAAIASFPFVADGSFMVRGLSSWLYAWVIMLPIALLAAPLIRKIVNRVTYEEP